VAAARPEVLAWSRLPDLSRAGLADYLRRRQRGGVSVAETNHDLQTWRAFGNWLLDEGRLAASPFSRMHEGHVPPAPPRVLTSDQIRALLAACRRPPEIRTGADGHHFMRPGAPAWLYPAVLIVAHTGIRPVELARLSWEGVDLERRMAVVRRKGHDYWPLSLPGPVLEWFERVPPAERRGPVVPGFPYHDGTSLMGNYGGPVAMAAEDAGLPGVTLYWLRHTVATELARQGLSEAQLQTAMGWKSSAMARRYVHLVGRDVAGVTDRLPWARPPAAP
jgi:integrase